jgi:hypothetical protein
VSDADVLASFTDDQLEWLAAQPGPIKRAASDEQQRRADAPNPAPAKKTAKPRSKATRSKGQPAVV